MSDEERVLAEGLANQFMKFIGKHTDHSLSAADRAKWVRARNKLIESMKMFTEIDPTNIVIALEEVRTLPRKQELHKVYAAMEQQIRYDIAYPPKDTNSKRPPRHVFINTIEFDLFKDEFKNTSKDPFQ